MGSRARPKPKTIEPPGSSGELSCVPWRAMLTETEAWDALAQCAAEPNPFYESWYLLPSLASFDDGNAISILRFTCGGTLCALMPVVRESKYAGWPLAHIRNWLHPNIFFGTPLVARGMETQFWRALLDWADDQTRLSLFLHLHEFALSGPVFESLESLLASDGRIWGVVEDKERALLASGLAAEDYLAQSLSSRKRKDLNRRARRLSEIGEISFAWESGTDRIAPWIEEFLALEASGWKGEAASALACDAATRTLFRESLTGAAARQRLVRLSLRLNDTPIAMLSTFLTPPGAFGFKTAFDEDYACFSPGLLLEREFLGALQRFDIDWCDSCAAPDHSVMNRMWQERRPLGRLSIAIGGPLRRATFGQVLRREMANADLGANT